MLFFSVSNTLIVSRTKKMDVFIMSSVVRVFTACFLWYHLSTAAPVITTETKAIMYLQKCGYMEEAKPNSSLISGEAAFSDAIIDFQRFAGLTETGILDKQTLNMMKMSRCGVPYQVGHNGTSRRRKRYALSGSKWNKKNLTYKILKYPTSIKDRAKVDEEIAKAFKVWSDVSGLNFEVSEDPVDIEISFEKGNHGDGYNNEFDGPGGKLGHAFSPVSGGSIHFDDEEEWTIGVDWGTNLFQYAIHAFGIALGLYHSDIKSAAMFHRYQGYNHNPLITLDEDDILGIQKLYGPPEKKAAPEPESKPEPESNLDANKVPDLCQNASIDAATVTNDGRSYVFKGNYYWEIEETGISDGYPRKISDYWYGLPGDLDAALTSTSGETFFFKKNQYWRFYNKISIGNPHNISGGFRGIPNDIDTAFSWNGKIYFFKGDSYWHYNGSEVPPVSSIYPLPIRSSWKGLPSNINAAFQWNRNTYFFKESKYYRISGTIAFVDNAHPPFPRSTSVWWNSCKKVPDLCQDTSINAATSTESGQIDDKFYVFKGNYYWEIGMRTGISEGYPREIFDDWSGLPGDLDAAVTFSNGKTYFFKKNLHWRFHNKEMDSGYPKSISEGFPGIPNDIDAAFVWSANKKAYFFKGENYWRFDDGSKSVASRYPQPITNWQGLPNNMDAAVEWRNKTYIFKGNQYYKLNDEVPSVVIPEPPYSSYPRPTYSFIFDCEDWKKTF